MSADDKMFNRKKKTPQPGPGEEWKENLVVIPTDDAPFWKKLDSTGYVLLHPELRKKAFLFTIVKTIVETLLVLLVATFLYLEITSFMYLGSHYGFVG